jgi:hypothetical protein
MYQNLSVNGIIDLLDKKDKIIFGPFFGSYSWEIYNWSGFIRWYCKNYPDKQFVISTRKDRKGLYDCDLNFELFELEEEIDQTEGYIIKNFENDEYIENLSKKYKDFYIFQPDKLGNRENIFDLEYMDFDFKTSYADKNIIKQIKKQNKNRIPISIFSKTNPNKNYNIWNNDNWKMLIDMLESTSRFLVFNLGITPTYYCYPNKISVFNLNDYYNDILNTTITGLSIEAIRNSRICIGVTNANTILSFVLEKDCILWGHENQRYITNYNINSNVSKFTSRDYNLNPAVIFEELIKKLKS